MVTIFLTFVFKAIQNFLTFFAALENLPLLTTLNCP